MSWFTRMLRERAGLQTRLDWRLPEELELGAEFETRLFRIAQEALNNLVRYAARKGLLS